MTKYDRQPRFIAMVRKFHYDMQARVQNDGAYFKPLTDGGQTGLCTKTVRHDVFCHAHRCFSPFLFANSIWKSFLKYE